MTPFVGLKGTSARFIQKSIWKRNYELTEGDKTIGTLSFPSVFSDRSTIECAKGSWILDTKGVFNPVVTVRSAAMKRPLTTISLKQTRGTYTLKLPHYRTLRLTTNIWKSEFVLKTSMNAMLCTLKLQHFPKFGGDATIERDAEYIREYPWLVYLVVYIALLQQRRSAIT